jgi:hypothetical protein
MDDLLGGQVDAGQIREASQYGLGAPFIRLMAEAVLRTSVRSRRSKRFGALFEDHLSHFLPPSNSPAIRRHPVRFQALRSERSDAGGSERATIMVGDNFRKSHKVRTAVSVATDGAIA